MPQHEMDMAVAPTGPSSSRRERPRDIPDDADEKWTYPEHTAAKHNILRPYLSAWLVILGRGKRGFRHKQLVLLDGFYVAVAGHCSVGVLADVKLGRVSP
jgi:hypothetical protein